MFETKVTFQGKEYKLRFGAWVMGLIEKMINQGDTGSIDIFASLIFYGLIMGEKLRPQFTADEKLPFDIFDCYDWIDEQGGVTSDEVERILDLYAKFKDTNVPKSDKKKVVETKKKK